MFAPPHPLDPNFIDFLLPERRIYGSAHNEDVFAVVDDEDYHWLVRWAWRVDTKRKRNGAFKQYFRRVLGNTGVTLYMHVEILKRTGLVPPSRQHVLVDHIDGDTFNCRRSNLRWATYSMNSHNLYGRAAAVDS